MDDLNRAVDTLLADVSKTMSTADASLMGRLLPFQTHFIEYHSRWKAWYGANITTAAKMKQAAKGFAGESDLDAQFQPFRSEFESLYSQWTVALGQKATVPPKPPTPEWLQQVQKVALLTGLGALAIAAIWFGGPILFSYLARKLAMKAASKALLTAAVVPVVPP